jgi:flagellar biosynthesis protein FliR
MQIYFVSVPGQIMFGLALLAMTSGAITLAWRDQVATFLKSLPGAAY